MDFTLDKYSELLQTLLNAGYAFLPFSDFLTTKKHEEDCFEPHQPPLQLQSKQHGLSPRRIIILRHDVDLKPHNSLATAKIEHAIGIRATYYFRAVPQSWDEQVIREIASLGHEVGYHYESLTTCAGNVDLAYDDFCANLKRLRELVPVSTICMHGSPRSPWDSKDIWKKFNYNELKILGEPYLDTDWSNVFYLTDTGRRWDGYKVSVRDKIPHWQDVWNERGLTFHSTDDIIRMVTAATAAPKASRSACELQSPCEPGKSCEPEKSDAKLPPVIMVTTHPQRWMPCGIGWIKELLMQNAKNVIKGILAKRSAQQSTC